MMCMGKTRRSTGWRRGRRRCLGARRRCLCLPGRWGTRLRFACIREHGQEVICEARSHVLDWEMAMVAAFSGCVPRTVAGERGVLTWEQIAKAIAPKIYYRAPTGLMSIENTHNMAGGTVTPVAVLEEIWAGREGGGAADASGWGAGVQCGGGAGGGCGGADDAGSTR